MTARAAVEGASRAVLDQRARACSAGEETFRVRPLNDLTLARKIKCAEYTNFISQKVCWSGVT